MHQAATWCGGRPEPGRLCDRWGPSLSSPERGGAPNFQPMSIVVKRLHGSMLIGTEVGVGLQDIVLDGDPASLPKGA